MQIMTTMFDTPVSLYTEYCTRIPVYPSNGIMNIMHAITRPSIISFTCDSSELSDL